MRVCCVLGCKNKGQKIFPQNEIQRLLWIKAIKLDENRKMGWKLSKYSAICYDHFKPHDFHNQTQTTSSKVRRKLKNHAVPSVFPWSPKDVVPDFDDKTDDPLFDHNNVSQTFARRELPIPFIELMPYIECEAYEHVDDPLQIAEEVCDSTVGAEVTIESNEFRKVSTETDNSQESKCLQHKHVQTETQTSCSIYNYRNNNKGVHFYTGLETYDRFLFVFETLGADVHNLNYFYGNSKIHILDPLDQFFITLIILRRHKEFEEIAWMFLIDIKQVYNIFITWVRFMALQWREECDLWANKENVQSCMPLDFYDKYPQTRVILDATECPIDKSKLPLAQQITFSTYKNRNTVKTLIGITPSGLISYVSPCYGGSATDRQIIERSTILKRFDFRDEIMVDKGLNVQDIFLPYGVKVNMPAFFKKSNQINRDTMHENRNVASKRVHVERVIGLMKSYKILKTPMNMTESKLSSDIIFIIAMLVNFRSRIIKKTA